MKVTIEEPSVAIASKFSKVERDLSLTTIMSTTDEATETAVKYAHRYLTSRQLPDSAIDLLDEAAVTVQNRDSNGHGRRVDRLGSGFDGWQVVKAAQL